MYRCPRLTFHSLMPPEDVLADAVDCYFQFCHMQPLWLFDREEFSSIQDCREETLFSLLALSLCHSRHPFFRGRSDELSKTYGQAARERIMRQIGDGNVSLSTIQSLCLLALANLQGQCWSCIPWSNTCAERPLQPTTRSWCLYTWDSQQRL